MLQVEKILRKRMVSEGHLPKKEKQWYFTDQGTLRFVKGKFYIIDGFIKYPTFWYEEEEAFVLTEEELKSTQIDFAKNLLVWLGLTKGDHYNESEIIDLYDHYLATKQDEPVR